MNFSVIPTNLSSKTTKIGIIWRNAVECGAIKEGCRVGRVEKQEFWIISNVQVDSAVRNKYKNVLLNR